MADDKRDLPPFIRNWRQFYLFVVLWLAPADGCFLFLHELFFMSLIDWLVLGITLLAIVTYESTSTAAIVTWRDTCLAINPCAGTR
jgi:hypothetical protein